MRDAFQSNSKDTENKTQKNSGTAKNEMKKEGEEWDKNGTFLWLFLFINISHL